MTSNPNYIGPQSASAPITTNLRKDELAALLTVDQGATAQQRIVATGNSIPLVFARQTSTGIGGVWVTPPAARYGVEENANTGDYFAFGLVISDGRISSIASADIWKGPIRCNSLSGFGATNAYGSLPTSGFNYTLTSVGADTPATSETTTTQSNFSLGPVNYAFNGTSYVYTVNNCVRWDASLQPVTNLSSFPTPVLQAKFDIYANGARIDGSSGAIGSWTKAHSFSTPVTFQISMSQISSPGLPNFSQSTYYAKFATLNYTTQTSTTVTTPAIPGAVTNLPLFAGAGGTFAGMSTLAVKGRYAVDAETGIYKQQVRCFVRNGVQIDRVLGGNGSSCSFPDLAYYLLRNASKISDNLIDLPSLQAAENFNAKYQLYFNGVLANSVNLRDYLTRVAPMFMLRFVQVNGKFGLKPVLPLDSGSNITLDTLTPKYVFDSSNLVAGTYQKSYINIGGRKKFCALMTWRSQTDSIYGTPKTLEVRYAGTAIDGPFEQYDMEEFCTTKNHAAIIGKYIIASRKLITHTIGFQTTELIGDLVPTDIITVSLDYGTSVGIGESSTIFYQVDTVSEGADGVFSVEATHFPTTAAGISQVALDVLTGF